MIIHHQEDFSNYKLCLYKSLKYSDTFTFIPIKIYKNKYSECIIQTPLLFTPFGIQKTQNNYLHKIDINYYYSKMVHHLF